MFVPSMVTRAFRRGFASRPRRIILCRHGESEGNVNEDAYVSTADWKISLTQKGRGQVRESGRKLAELVGDDPMLFYCSPYRRAEQTMEELRKCVDEDNIWGVKEEPRISEQQFGNFQNVEQVRAAKAERQQFGRFFFRFPNGESGLDVYNRVTGFTGTILRDFQAFGKPLDLNVVVVTHGLALRLFLMRWFHMSVDEFEKSVNPHNAQLIVMERCIAEGTDDAYFRLTQETVDSCNLPDHLAGTRIRFDHKDFSSDGRINFDFRDQR